jgi:hypothetical protein
MILGLLIVILLILVVWFGSTSYGPKLLMNYAFVSMSSQHPQMEMEMRRAGVSKWQLAALETKREFVRELNAEIESESAQIKAAGDGLTAVPTPAPTPVPTPTSTPNSAAAPAPAIAPVPVVAPASAAAPASASTSPTPVVEKFRTNMAQMFGSMHA